MKITRSAAIQCMIVLFVLTAGIVYTGKYSVEQDEQVQAETEPDNSAEKNRNAGSSSDKKNEEIEDFPELGKPEGIVKPAETVREKVSAELTDTEFIYGAIRMILPEKCIVEYQEQEDGLVCVCLSAEDDTASVEKLYFIHYRAGWNHKWELILAAMELTGQEYVGWFSVQGDSGPEERNFIIRAWDEESREECYVLVCDEDMYLLKGSTADYLGFKIESEEQGGNLIWDDLGGYITAKAGCSVWRLGEKHAVYLLIKYGFNSQRNYIYTEDNLAEPVQKLDGNIMDCGDINFDGYPDIEIYDGKQNKRNYFLWDGAKERFLEAVLPLDDISDSYYLRKCEGYGTYWDCDQVWDDHGERRELTERLYRWDGIVLEEFRNISCQVQEDEVSVVLTDSESGECLASGTFLKKGWERDPEVRALYRQFYQGYAPEDFYYLRHDAPGEEEVIPDCMTMRLKDIL